MDVAEAELNRFIERRAEKVKEGRTGQEHANRLEQAWRDSEARHRQQSREHNRWEWIRYFERLSHNHAVISEMYADRAEQLINRGDDAA